MLEGAGEDDLDELGVFGERPFLCRRDSRACTCEGARCLSSTWGEPM